MLIRNSPILQLTTDNGQLTAVIPVTEKRFMSLGDLDNMEVMRWRTVCFFIALFPPEDGAGDGTRTRDNQLGRLVFYQLNDSRFSQLSQRHLIKNPKCES